MKTDIWPDVGHVIKSSCGFQIESLSQYVTVLPSLETMDTVSGDLMALVCQDSWLGLEPAIVSHYPAKFSGHRHLGNGDGF